MKIVTKMKRVRTSRSLACSRVKFSTVADEIERLGRIKWRNIEPLVELSNRVKINDNYAEIAISLDLWIAILPWNVNELGNIIPLVSRIVRIIIIILFTLSSVPMFALQNFITSLEKILDYFNDKI